MKEEKTPNIPRASGTATLRELFAINILEALIKSPHYYGGKEASSQVLPELIVSEAVELTDMLLNKVAETEEENTNE